jgi:hypothetical protein
MPEKPKTISTNRARGGIGTHVVRYVLVISTALAIGAMIWVYFAAPSATDPTMETGPSVATSPQGDTTPPPPAPR